MFECAGGGRLGNPGLAGQLSDGHRPAFGEEPGQAVEWARRLNDFEAEQVAHRPDRFAGFAALPMQDPDQAITELRRCVRELGFVGAMINGFSQVGAEDTAVYLDDPRYRPFWAEVQELDVPIYLHPRDSLPSQSQIYQGHPWLLGSAWAFSVETGTHALRLMGSGLFDTYPRLQVILGHFGELLPFNIWRTDHRIEVGPRGIPAQRPLGHYLRNNFHLTGMSASCSNSADGNPERTAARSTGAR